MKKIIALTLSIIVMVSMRIGVSAEEDTMQIMPIYMELYSVVNEIVNVDGKEITSDVPVQVIDGVTFLPLRSTLEALGFEVTWNSETKSVELSKGAQWTSVTIGSNAYFKNKMAPHTLSSAPVIVNGRTLVPVEFIADIIGRNMTVENNQIMITDEDATIHEGYVQSFVTDESGKMTLTLTSDLTSDSFEYQMILHLDNSTLIRQVNIEEGQYVHAVSPMFMTMSIPAQTGAYIIY